MRRFLLLLAGLLFVSGGAEAQGVDALGRYEGPKADRETRQSSAAELRLGPYEPNVDDEVAGTPYATSFGSKRRWMLGFEVDWQLLRIEHVGSLGPAVQFGYVRISGKAPFADGSGTSDQDQRLWILPIHALAVFRLDVLAVDVNVPLVPYGKLGGSYAFWSCTTGGVQCRLDDNTRGRGAEYGFQYAAGLMFLLDFLDPVSANDMDHSMGINNSYFFGEYSVSDIDSFGDGLQVGADGWTLGLAFEY